MADHISRFVSDDGYALSFVRCEQTAQLIGHEQHGMAYDGLAFAAKGMIAALLMGTRLKGPGMLSLNVNCDAGRIRDFRIDAMGLGFVRGLIRKIDNGEDLIENGLFTVMKQIEGSDEPFQSSVPINHARLIHACNAYLRNSEQVQALMCHDTSVTDNNVDKANGFYLERLPAADKNPDCHLSKLYEELYESGQDFVRLDENDDDVAMVAELFGKDQFNKLNEYPVKFYCPCSRERYMETLRNFSKKQLQDLLNDHGMILTRCDFCQSEYEIALDDLI